MLAKKIEDNDECGTRKSISKIEENIPSLWTTNVVLFQETWLHEECMKRTRNTQFENLANVHNNSNSDLII